MSFIPPDFGGESIVAIMYNPLIKEKRALEVHLSDHCNLNCMGCSHFSPLAPKRFLDNDDLIVSLRSIDRNVRDYFTQIRLVGGEPLLNPDIVRILKTIRLNFVSSDIMIVTNGILIPTMPISFWDECEKSRVSICVTIYPKINYDEIFKVARNRNTKVSIYADRSGESGFERRPLSIHGKEDAHKNFDKCRFIQQWSCLQLVGTKLYVCPTSAYISLFERKFNRDIGYDEYLDLSKIKSLEEIKVFVSRPKQICRYCNINGIITVTWKISHSRIDEWT